MQAAWEQTVVGHILGGMAAMRCFCRDLEQRQQQGLAHLQSLHQTEAQVGVSNALLRALTIYGQHPAEGLFSMRLWL